MRMAKLHKVHIVSPQWLIDCEKHLRKADEDLYPHTSLFAITKVESQESVSQTKSLIDNYEKNIDTTTPFKNNSQNNIDYKLIVNELLTSVGWKKKRETPKSNLIDITENKPPISSSRSSQTKNEYFPTFQPQSDSAMKEKLSKYIQERETKKHR